MYDADTTTCAIFFHYSTNICDIKKHHNIKDASGGSQSEGIHESCVTQENTENMIAPQDPECMEDCSPWLIKPLPISDPDSHFLGQPVLPMLPAHQPQAAVQ